MRDGIRCPPGGGVRLRSGWKTTTAVMALEDLWILSWTTTPRTGLKSSTWRARSTSTRRRACASFSSSSSTAGTTSPWGTWRRSSSWTRPASGCSSAASSASGRTTGRWIWSAPRNAYSRSSGSRGSRRSSASTTPWTRPSPCGNRRSSGLLLTASMATVEMSFTPLPVHVRTARLVATAVARRSGVPEAHRAHCPAEPVRIELTGTRGRFEVVVTDAAARDDDGALDHEGAHDHESDSSAAPGSGSDNGYPGADGSLDDPEALLPQGLGLAVIAGLADDVKISRTAAGLSIRMSWPSGDSTG